MAWAYLLQILPGRAPCLCNFDITTTTKNPTTKTTPRLKPPNLTHTKTTCALGMFRSGFKHGILSSSHFQIIRWDAKVTWPLWMVTWLRGWGDPAFLEKETGWQSLVTFLANLWLGKKKITEPSTETHKIPFLVSSTEVIIG